MEAAPPTIAILPDQVVDQIAAGEVVERPASVVKELVENALDAGARTITIEVDGGGRRMVRVVDDGHGMAPGDARLALARHATSKLRTVDDLGDLTTMGFRGEALPSIASVSRLTLTTRARGAEVAVRIVVEGGRVVSEEPCAAPTGTTMAVADLLHNVPARLKFLRGEATEASHVTETVERLALAHPEVGFRLRHAGRIALEVGPSSAAARVRTLLGARMAERLHEVVFREGGVVVRAYLAAPELAQTTSRGVQLFAGRRWIRDRGLLQAVTMGYGELVPRGRYPVAIVFVDVPGGEIDVNVHPQKLEVRFSDAAAVGAAVRHAVRQGVAAAPWLTERATSAPIQLHAVASTAPPRRADNLAARYASDTVRALFPTGGLGRAPARQEALELGGQGAGASEGAARDARGSEAAAGATRPTRGDDAWAVARARVAARTADRDAQLARGRETAPDSGSGSGSVADSVADSGSGSTSGSGSRAGAGSGSGAGSESGASADAGSASASGTAVDVPTAESFFAHLRYLGQLDRTYLVCEGDGEMVLIDQHAAHERVEFQRLRERAAADGVAVQRLLFPTVLELPPSERALVVDGGELLAAVGFDVEPFSGSTVAVKAVPAGLRQDPAVVLRELLAELVERGGSRAVDQRLDQILATVACHSVVRAGDVLAPDEVRSLLAQMDGVDFRAHCPHGRPVLLRVGISELARRFGRT